jgi:Flp pilus assembly protein TadG
MDLPRGPLTGLRRWLTTLPAGPRRPSAPCGPSRWQPRIAPARHQRGQALVEFALVVPVFILLLGAVMQFGLILWSAGTLSHILNDTGRWAAASQACTSPAVQTQANQVASYSNLIGYTGPSSLTVTSSFDPGCPPPNNTASVYVTISMSYKVPIFFPVVPGNGWIGVKGQFRIEPAPQ